MLGKICNLLDKITAKLSFEQLLIAQAICIGISVCCAVYSLIILGSNP